MNTKMIHRQGSLLLKRKSLVLIVVLVVIFASLLFVPTRGFLTQTTYSIAVGIWSGGNLVTNAARSFITNFKDKNLLENENSALKAELSRLQALALDRNLLSEKVASLEESLGRPGSDNRVAADVVAGPRHSPYDTLVIDAGTEQGISVGNMVVYAGSGVVGEIVEVSGSTAKVKIYSSSGVETSVAIGEKHIPVTAVGRGMGNFEARVPQDSIVLVGDTVTSIKGSLILGNVALVEENTAKPFKSVFFRVPFNITEMQSVEVLVDKHK